MAFEGCPETNEFNETRYDWVHDAFGACVYSPAQCAAVFIGFMSIGCWIVAQIPQLYENFKNKSASALSVGFLLFWTLGDSSNLVGCVLTDQLPTQTYTALYFCFVDVCLWSQFFYYTYVYPKIYGEHTEEESQKLINDDANKEAINSGIETEGGDPMKAFEAKQQQQQQKKKRVSRRGSYLFAVAVFGMSLAVVNLVSSATLLANGGGAAAQQQHNEFVPARSLLSTALSSASSSSSGSGSNGSGSGTDPAEIAGTVIAWLCAALYLSSRMPQILLNWQRASVQGLSIHLFIFAVLGNLTYVLSIVLSVTYAYELLDSLPYIIGSGGTLFFDFTIFLQFKIYSASRKEYVAIEGDAS